MVNQKHFLTDFKITEFKCLKDFEITGFSQFNIILGGHNVGKTTLLEAMHASTCAASIDQLNTAPLTQRLFQMMVWVTTTYVSHTRRYLD